MRSQGVACCGLAYVEGHAAIARRGPAEVIDGMRGAMNRVWEDVIVVHAAEEVIANAADLASRHRLRGYDAVHLAAALLLRDRVGEVSFACWDGDLNAAAELEGLRVSRSARR